MEEATPAPSLRPPLQPSASPRDNEPDDLARLLKWQEDRIARKLRGEYESALLHLSEVITDNLDTPMNIASVRVEGAPHTRRSFLDFLIRPLMAAPPAAANANASAGAGGGNLESVLHTTRRISDILQRTDIFHSVEAKIERAQDGLAGRGDVDVVFKTRERGRFYLNTSTEVGNNEGNASATARIRNVFGGAETFEANVSLGTKTRKSFRATLSAPLSRDLGTQGEVAVFGLERDNSSYASSSEGLRGVKAVVRSGTPARGVHEFAYEAVLRHIGDLKPTASISMREAAGQTTKMAVSHTYLVDTRDDRIACTRGHYVKVAQEVAGLGVGGDAHFYRAEAEGHAGRSLGGGVTLSLAARSGLLWGLSSAPTLFSDRFQLGGPVSVRGFKANGLGPKDGTDSLGGDIYWCAGASLISDIPKKPHWPVKAHLWVNAGRLDVVDRSQPLSTTVVRTLARPSISAGVGIIYRFDPVRVEVNFGVPLVGSANDGMRRGVGVGMGLEFL